MDQNLLFYNCEKDCKSNSFHLICSKFKKRVIIGAYNRSMNMKKVLQIDAEKILPCNRNNKKKKISLAGIFYKPIFVCKSSHKHKNFLIYFLESLYNTSGQVLEIVKFMK